MNKTQMRRAMQETLRRVTPTEMEQRSRAVAERLRQTRAWAEMDILFCFLSMPGEIGTGRLIRLAREAGKPVAVPRIEDGEIRFLDMPAGVPTPPRDRWGIPVPDPAWRPVDPARAGKVLVSAPGLAFDRSGNRLGRGKGYYDRFLARARAARAGLVVIGICFAEQLVQEVPHTETDQRLDGVVTEAETLLLGGADP